MFESKEVETIISEKFDYVIKKIKPMHLTGTAIGLSICTGNLERAYQIPIENPNITRTKYLEMMQINEE